MTGTNVLAKTVAERRTSPRENVEARVRVSHEKTGVLDGYSKNISDTGVFVYLAAVPILPPGAAIGLQMMDSVSPGIMFHTELVRTTDYGMALHIVDYEIDGRRYSLEELRRQWQVSKAELDQG